jgi:hypothetical protein
MTEPYPTYNTMPPTYHTTPTLDGRYDFQRAQTEDWLNEYRALLQRVRWLQAQLLKRGAIKRKAVIDKD